MKPISRQIAQHLISSAISEMTSYLMEDYDCTLEEAMDKLYSSHLMTLLQDESTELYIQSPAYLYDLLKNEIS